MRCTVKNLHSADVPNYDLENYTPEQPDHFGICIEMEIVPIDEKGNEIFQFMLCTPKWFQSNFEKEDIIWGKDYIIVFEYNYNKLLAQLTTYVERIVEDDFATITNKISRIAQSEFEDYDENN